MSMRRPSRTGLAAAALVTLAAGPLAACGSSGDPIPAARAADLEARLDAVKTAVDNGNCSAAEQAVAQAKGAVLNLPSSVDADLRGRLEDGVANLADLVPAQCGAGGSSTGGAFGTRKKRATVTSNGVPSSRSNVNAPSIVPHAVGSGHELKYSNFSPGASSG